MITEVYLDDPTGVRLEALDYITGFEYAKIKNAPGPVRLTLPARFDRSLARLDNIIEIWRGYDPGSLKLDYCGFVRGRVFGDSAGQKYTELYGYSPLDLLRRRIVANAAGSAEAEMTDYADDMIKAIVTDQLGADAAADRDLTSVGGGFTVQADTSDGQSITKGFAYKNVLEICQEICDASAQAGTRVYFDVVPVVSSSVTGMLAFQFRTYTDYRGDDRTWDSDSPLYVGAEWGNFQNGMYGEDYSELKNYVYALGQGEGVVRDIEEAEDATSEGLSIWNRCEGGKDARHIEFGDTDGLTAEAYTYLEEHKAVTSFDGEVVETPSFRYGKDWNFGDGITIAYAGVQKEAMIAKVKVRRDSDGQETITAKLEVLE